MSTPDPLVVPPTEKHTASVILVHGLGDTGRGWDPITGLLGVYLPHIKWILPHAPTGVVTAERGKLMPRWFDISSFSPPCEEEDREGMLEAARMIDTLIQREVDAGIPSNRIVLGGFSQGASVVLLTALTARRDDGLAGGTNGWELGGVVVISGWLPLQVEFKQLLSPYAVKTPVFWGHGTDDSTVRCKLAKDGVKKLTSDCGIPMLESFTLGMEQGAYSTSDTSSSSRAGGELGSPGLSFRMYQTLGHSAKCPQELGDLMEFLKRVVPGSPVVEDSAERPSPIR